MSFITAIGTAVPQYKHKQKDICDFYTRLFSYSADEQKRIELLYERSGINTRYSVIPDYSVSNNERAFYPATHNLEPFPTLEQRMEWYHPNALKLAMAAIHDCLGNIAANEITHLITVSCTGLAAPGLDIELAQHLQLTTDVERSSINFMGCYAALHGLKQAHYIATVNAQAKVLVVCVELCTLHFQKKNDADNITSTLLFGDGAAAMLICGKEAGKDAKKTLKIKGFHSEFNYDGRNDMAWQLSGSGFLMTLSSYIPKLLEEDIESLVNTALYKHKTPIDSIKHWAIHPGGRKILEVIQEKLHLNGKLDASYEVLKQYGNMSSPTVLFVLKQLWEKEINWNESETIFSAAFGPGITMETVLLETA